MTGKTSKSNRNDSFSLEAVPNPKFTMVLSLRKVKKKLFIYCIFNVFTSCPCTALFIAAKCLGSDVCSSNLLLLALLSVIPKGTVLDYFRNFLGKLTKDHSLKMHWNALSFGTFL